MMRDSLALNLNGRRLWGLGWAVAFFILVLVGGGMFSEPHAERAIRFFEHLTLSKGEFAGKLLRLLDWEKEVIRDVYGTLKEDGSRQYRYVYIEIPKKNGKSALAAGAALYHMYADGEKRGEVYSCASNRKQAAIVFNVAADMVKDAPALKKRTRKTLSQKKMEDTVTGTTYEVLSADVLGKHGFDLSACVFDELHEQPNRKLWDVMTFGSGSARRQPIWWIITTAGEDPDRVSICWEQHDYAMRILSGDVIDPTWYVKIFNYEGDDIFNEENWYKANPSLGHTLKVEDLRMEAVKAKVKPAEERLFRWLRLNQWVTSKLTTWLPLDLFDQTVGSWTRADQMGKECYVGLDLSSTTDLTSICVVFPPQGAQLDWRVFWETFIPRENMQERIERDHVPYDQWEKAGGLIVTEGNVIDYGVVKEKILEIKKFFKVLEICADRAFAAMLIQELEKDGLKCVDVPQTFMSLTNPLNETERLLKEKKLTHENNAVARWTFGNASIAQNGNGQKKLVKEHKGKSVIRTKRIDPIAAWMDAMARAVFYTGKVDLSASILSDDWGM